MAPPKKRQPSPRATPAAKRGKKGADERRFTPEDDALILAWAAEHTTGERISWKGCAEALFSGRDVTDDHVRFAYHQIMRTRTHAAAAPARAAAAAARRLDAREDDAAHKLRRLDALRRFAESTDPKVMAQLHTCPICERAFFHHEIYKSPKAAFSAAADKERGDEPSTFTVKQFVEYLDGPPKYTTIYEALREPEPEEEDEEELPTAGARRRGTRGPRRPDARRGSGAYPSPLRPPRRAPRRPTRAEGGLHQPQARTRRPGVGPYTCPCPTYSMQSARGPRTCSTGWRSPTIATGLACT